MSMTIFPSAVLCPGVPRVENPAYAINNVGLDDGGLQRADDACLQGRGNASANIAWL